MGKEQESTASNYLVPSAGNALARRSDALVVRGLRDLEAVEQGGRGRIFVVDDQESLREVICSMLTSAGYECTAFAGGLVQTVTARKLSMVARSWRWCCRHRTESALGATIAMMLIAFGITASAAYLAGIPPTPRIGGDSQCGHFRDR